MSRAPQTDSEIILGRILASFGVRGEVRIFLHNRNSDLLGQELQVVLQSPSGERRPCPMRMRPGAGKRVLGSIPGVHDKESADALKDWDIRYSKELLPDLVDGEFYHHELMGTPVETESGRQLGRLAEIYQAGGVDCWVVRDGQSEVYIAAIQENVFDVIPGKHIIVGDHVDQIL